MFSSGPSGDASRIERHAGGLVNGHRLAPTKHSRAWGAVIAAAGLAAAACSPPPPDESGYIERLLEDRAVKDEAFAEGEDSPVPLDRRSWMLPIRYYDPNRAYRVPARLNVSEDRPVFQIPTSTGQMRSMEQVGTLEFMLNGEPRSLSAFIELPIQDIAPLFVPFRDETSGNETYPACRYIDLDRTPTGIYDLDFNRAYHPYCYYDETYDCPFPPPENRLATAVQAGERLPPEDERRFPIGGIEQPSGDDSAGTKVGS